LLILLSLAPATVAYGQGWPTLDSTGRSVERNPDLLEQNKPAPSPAVSVPPPTEKEPAESIFKSVFIGKVIVKGSTVFTAEELARVTGPYENRHLTMTGLESLRRDLTLLYVNSGYINSGAVFPDQTVEGGEITINVVEGKLSSIDVEGTKWFSGNFLRARIERGTGGPLDIRPLQDRLQLLQQDQRIQSIQAELRPGARPGESQLNVKVEEKSPFYVWLAFNNYQPPSVGAERGMVTLAHQNLTGHGDVLSFTYGRSEGLNPLIDTWYALPVNSYDTSFLFRYRKNDFNVVDNVFGALDIVSSSESFELTLRQPLYRTLNHDLALGLTLEHERNRTTLLGEPFSFSPGEDNGVSRVIPLRFSQEWTYRTQRQVIAARSRLTFGLHVWDATFHDTRGTPDGRFFAWLTQLQWARVLGFLDTQILARADLQLANKSLLPIEQFAVGGRNSVRGYRENLLVRDQGVVASLETRIPIVRNQRWADYLQICPFFDFGRGFNRDLPSNGPSDLESIGVGLRWGAAAVTRRAFELRPEIELYWGHALRHIEVSREDVQDAGVHLQVALTSTF
jgi:hemolysin activation/secretion protein